jgi:hypothetical protein
MKNLHIISFNWDASFFHVLFLARLIQTGWSVCKRIICQLKIGAIRSLSIIHGLPGQRIFDFPILSKLAVGAEYGFCLVSIGRYNVTEISVLNLSAPLIARLWESLTAGIK